MVVVDTDTNDRQRNVPANKLRRFAQRATLTLISRESHASETVCNSASVSSGDSYFVVALLFLFQIISFANPPCVRARARVVGDIAEKCR